MLLVVKVLTTLMAGRVYKVDDTKEQSTMQVGFAKAVFKRGSRQGDWQIRWEKGFTRVVVIVQGDGEG